MNLPNMLTSLRFVMIPVYLYVFAKGHMIPAFLVIIAAGMTDILDGYIARRSGQVTEIGMMLDPLADKLMFFTVVLSLLMSGLVSWTAAGAIFLRDLGMIAGGLLFHLRGKKTVPANWMGKLTTIMFYFGIMFIFFKAAFAEPYLWVVIVFSYLTWLMYFFRILSLNKQPPDQQTPTIRPRL